MKRNVRVILKGSAKDAFKKLNKIVGEQLEKGKTNSQEIQLLNSIKKKVELLKANPSYGDNIPKKLIPKKWDVDNLWRVELTSYWRILYTIAGDRIEVICFIVEIIDHPTYDKMFGYRKK
jgi:mRNA-degrading endonuclease RelE of RelBE toxin-antitoxin system